METRQSVAAAGGIFTVVNSKVGALTSVINAVDTQP